ncbi:hypothetical protein SAMN02982929_06808 [Saccharopolyspora kobensis]|uniref:Uncharacterized protein n=1 Tax=Saccharopolyspora kobensis TaxID=146035 RepID=A0A1H6EIC5_9PSEU|nr:hypothetical protein [Saccharopolyspora kobensis]SEG97587.1 hypothetical protein SAMN02982929_06808 [Saccharopolyspora kobensis]SFE93924.1 hypothetical protein SAMN05216506_11655 [Saccharopolyspora kobensis]
MVIERNRWVRRLLVVQPIVVWPVSFVLWSGGGGLGLALAVVLLWVSAAISVAGIVVPMRGVDRCRDSRRAA